MLAVIDVHLELYFCSIVHSCVLFNCLIELMMMMMIMVLFSIVAFKILDISHGSVATHLRCGEIFSD